MLTNCSAGHTVDLSAGTVHRMHKRQEPSGERDSHNMHYGTPSRERVAVHARQQALRERLKEVLWPLPIQKSGPDSAHRSRRYASNDNRRC